ncbi:MAG TPA: VIT1/CCC1 transporter family protein [Candidatus Limnocylindrales bacterium]|nr:VIT1/CCC1 transporter family protein [Candidatus Limnocylindrales bacterium]
MTSPDLETSLANLKLERDAIVLYDGLAGIERDPDRRAAFRTIATNERRHAGIWADRLRAAGANVPEPGGPRVRIRFILLVARLFGTRSVSELVQSLEGDEEELYLGQDDPGVASIVEDERRHAEIWRELSGAEQASRSPVAAASRTIERDGYRGVEAAAGDPGNGTAGAAVAPPPEEAQLGRHALENPAASEAWHRAGQTGTLRATIFGVSDGLVSNLSLVMGVVGASADNRVIVLAGVAGLLAGAFSMGAGEWISMTSQRELFVRQIELEREELQIMPEQEELELVGLYRRKGLPLDDARRLAKRLMADPRTALDTKVREELGLDPNELGSPWGAAIGSLTAFALGAFVPLVPFLAGSGTAAFVAAIVLSAVALFLVGAGVSLLTGRSALFSGLRQVGIGAIAAIVTYSVGAAIGVAAS